MIWQRITDAPEDPDRGTIRAWLDNLLCGLGIGDCHANNEVAFTAAVIALSAKMAKADGVASPLEFEAFLRIFKPPADEVGNVERLFQLATKDVAGFESYARQISELLKDERQLLRDVFDGLFYVAAADGILHDGEEHYLRRVAEIFGFNDATYRCTRSRFVHDPDDAYTRLGIDRSISDVDLKAHYKALARQHHPDALTSRGVPPEFIEMATRKFAAINSAYESIARERGLR